MKLRRFLRDFAVLISFCGAFYLLITFVNRLEGGTPDDVTDFSVARKTADSLAKNQNWNSAADEYRKLTEQDPYNGYAWERYAASYYTMRFNAIKELDELQEAGIQDPEKLNAVRARIDQYGDECYTILTKLREFARYRGFALLRMAVISVYRDNEESALKQLQEFVDNGHNTQLGLSEYSVFGRGGKKVLMPGAEIPDDCRLHYYPRFWEIVEKEQQNRASR